MSTDKRPRKIGKYDIKRRIGKGSMGVVYEGYDPFVQRPVAIKVAQDPAQADPQQTQKMRELFFSEVYAAGRMHHPSIVAVYDAGQIDGMNYIVMEFVDGHPLSDYVSGEQSLTTAQVVDSLYQCAVGLEYIHRQGIIHRDLKPANIMLTLDGQIKIMDFSIAHIEMGAGSDHAILGSPMYAPPEQVREHTTLVAESDIYSLGAVMYTLLARRPLFRAKTLDELTDKILRQDPDPLSLLRPDLPQKIVDIVEKCLEKDIEKRYPSAQALASDLSQAFGRLRMVGHLIDMQEKWGSMRQLRFFRDFSDQQISEIVDACDWIDYKKGDIIAAEGEIENTLYVITRGTVEVVKDGLSLDDMGPGDCFGEAALVTRSRLQASIVASSDVTVMALSNTLLEKTSMDTQLKYYRVFLDSLIQRLSLANERRAREAEPETLEQIEKTMEITCLTRIVKDR